jgi:glycyl-tRNA synthetase beta subunit
MNILKGSPISEEAPHHISEKPSRMLRPEGALEKKFPPSPKKAPRRRTINPSIFHEPAEKNLYQSFLAAKDKIDTYLNSRAYEPALLEMTQMKKPIDEFFDGVMVMVEDEKIRENRLALLDEIGKLFLRIADFSKLT